MRQTLLGILFLLFLAACSPNQQATEAIVIGVTFSATTFAEPSETSAPTQQSAVATATAIRVGDCTIPSGWVLYTVAAGDSLFAIARAADSSVEELVEGNCLESANLISTGQELYIPSDEAPSADGNLVYWLASNNATNSDSIEIGCQTFVTPIESNFSRSNDPVENIETALSVLFGVDDRGVYRNYWNDYNLVVNSVDIDDDTAIIELGAEDFLIGAACSNPEILAQILLIVFAESEIESAFITVDGMNLKQLADASGLSSEDAEFTRDDIR